MVFTVTVTMVTITTEDIRLQVKLNLRDIKYISNHYP